MCVYSIFATSIYDRRTIYSNISNSLSFIIAIRKQMKRKLSVETFFQTYIVYFDVDAFCWCTISLAHFIPAASGMHFTQFNNHLFHPIIVTLLSFACRVYDANAWIQFPGLLPLYHTIVRKALRNRMV